MSGIGLPHLDADHLVLLSTEANVVEWPRPIPRGAALTARLGERWIRGQLQWSRLTGRTSIRVPATGMCGVLVIQPFWMNDSDGRAAPVDPVAPPRRVLYLPDPILCEECVMYLACTARAPGGGEDVAGGRPARMGDVLRGILRSFRVGGRWTGGVDERGETRPGRLTSGRRASSSDEIRGSDDDGEIRPDDNADSMNDGDDDASPIAARTRAGRRKQQAADETVGNGHRLRTNPRTSRWSKSSVDDSEEQALLDLARLLFDDSCDAVALMDGCELSGGQGLLHLLNAFGRRLLRLGSRDANGDANGDVNGAPQSAGRDPQTQTSQSLETALRASGRFGRSRVMREVAEYGCPDTLRQLFELIGIADDIGAPGLGEALFGGADVPVDDTQLLTPLHVAAAASAVGGEDSTGAATELVRAMIGGCKDPHAWTRGVARDGVRADQYGVYRAFTGVEAPAQNPGDDSDDAEDGSGGSVAWDSETDDETETGTFSRRSGRNETRMTSSGLNGGGSGRPRGVAPPPRDLAGEDAQCAVHDLYTSAAELAVSALGAVATATAEPFLGELPQSVLEDALQRVIEWERDPTLTYLTSLILQDDQCWATFSYIYSLTRGPAQVWLAFPLAPSVDATMRCLGWSGAVGGDDGESIGGEVSNAAQGLGDHNPSDYCQEVASFRSRASRLQETWGFRPLVSQTPWNTRGLMQFEDPAVEAAFLRFADGKTTVAVNAGILVLCLLTSACMVLNGNFALLRGYLGCKPEAVDATTLAVRFFPMLAALTLGLVSAWCARLSNPLRVRMGCISVFRLMLAAVTLRSGGAVFHGENVAFDSAGLAIVPNGERSVFDPGAFADQFGVKTCAFFVLTTIVLPYLLPLRFGDHVVTSFLCGLVSWARFGSFFGVGGMGRMFRSEKDLAVRCALFAAAQVPMYVREYHMRFKFLMNKFGPGNRLEKEKVI